MAKKRINSSGCVLVNTSIKNNICLGIKDEKIDKAKLQRIIEEIKLQSLIDQKNGINENIEENGKNLSGGQKQKISLARALYFDREVLVFDEPTSSLDSQSQIEVHKVIDNLIGKKTIILISHKNELLNNFNKIYKIKNNNIELINPNSK